AEYAAHAVIAPRQACEQVERVKLPGGGCRRCHLGLRVRLKLCRNVVHDHTRPSRRTVAPREAPVRPRQEVRPWPAQRLLPLPPPPPATALPPGASRSSTRGTALPTSEVRTPSRSRR